MFIPTAGGIDTNDLSIKIHDALGEYNLIGTYSGSIKDFYEYLASYKTNDNLSVHENIVVIPSIKSLGLSIYKAIEVIIEVYEKYGFRLYSIEESWVYWLTSLTGEDWNQLKAFIGWMLKETVEKRRSRQVEAWRKGKRRGRPPAMDLKTVAHYVKRYRELALKNKKALWLIAKAEGHKISYRRFLEKVNKVLESNKI